MLLDLCTLAKEIIEKNLAEEGETVVVEEKIEENCFYLSFVEIDHMRDRKKYLKILSNWTKELAIGCRVLFCNTSRCRGHKTCLLCCWRGVVVS
jgi:hypothetical protein